MTSSSLTGSLPLAVGRMVNHQSDVDGAFDKFSPAIYRYVLFRVGGDTHLADDLMQQLWLAASGNRKSIAADRWEGWFRGIARNLVREHWRHVRHRPDQVPVSDSTLSAQLADRLANEDLPADTMQRRQMRDQLMLALTALPSQDQAVIAGHYLEGLSQAKLAGELGISERAVEGRLYRARQALRQQLKEVDPD